MAAMNEYPATGLQITFREDVTDPKQMQTAERSVSALIARSTEAGAQARAAEAELRGLTDALNAPVVKLIEGTRPLRLFSLAREACQWAGTKRHHLKHSLRDRDRVRRRGLGSAIPC
jgi:hypothetical protein